MSYLRLDLAPGHHNQSGAAFIVMLVILVLGVTTFLVTSLNSAGAKIQRDVKTTEALAFAKDALISEASTEVDFPNHHYPGSLPCPDTDDDGSADSGGNGFDCSQYIGRLPWKTLGLPDLRDASGERLWYTLSRNVRRYDSVRPLNSDTAGTSTVGTLAVSGSSSETDLLAIVFAPGDNVSGQSRSDNTAACATTSTSIKENRCAANYLEGSNDDPSNHLAQNWSYENANTAALLNDRLATVTRDQLMERTEKRVGGQIRNALKKYYEAWGAFPFPAAFVDPSTSSFTGQVGNYKGLLPIGDNVKPTWDNDPAISFSGSGSADSCYRDDSGGINNVRWKCDDVVISTGETVTITGKLNNVGRGLWRPHNVNNICEVRAKNSSGTSKLATDVLDNVVITNSLNTDGSATIVFQAKGKAGFGNLDRIELRGLLDYTTAIISNSNTSSCPPTSTNALIPAWLSNDATDGNHWHKVAYYAVAEEYVPGGDHTCTPTPCLTVNGQNVGNDIAAVVVMTGRDITGNRLTVPSNLTNYLESENSDLDNTYENQTRSSTFNDQVIPVPVTP